MASDLPVSPVFVRSSVDIVASDRDVWAVLADIGSWPTWNPAIRQSVFDAELEVGARFSFLTSSGSLRCRLVAVDAPRLLAWSGRLMTVRHRQSWTVDARPNGCRASLAASADGLAARIFRRRMIEQFTEEVSTTLELLRLEAETRSSEVTGSVEGRASTRG